MERVLARLAEDVHGGSRSGSSFSGPEEFDEIKALEGKLLEQIESSSLQAAAGNSQAALKNANEAARVFGSLRAAVQRSQQMRSSDINLVDGDGRRRSLGQPLTSGVNLFDLSIAVKCNLAERLKNNGQLEQALEMYTQICKMATIDQAAGDGPGALLSDSHTNQQQQQQQHFQSRSLLYRFGLDIGNVLYEMGEFQRALKYYRLTLDRMSTLTGHQSLQIKLMNNITITLMAMSGVIVAAPNRGRGADLSSLSSSSSSSWPVSEQTRRGALSSSRTNDHLASLGLLLADNSFDAKQSTTTALGGGSSGSARLNKSSAGDDQADRSNSKQVINGNHHRFALNLMACHHIGSDPAAIYTTLSALLHTNSCGPQFRRVPLASASDKLTTGPGEKRAEGAAAAATDSDDKSSDEPGRERDDRAPELAHVPARVTALSARLDSELELLGRSIPSRDRGEPSKDVSEKSEQNQLSAVTPDQGELVDELERLIQSRESQIRGALLAGCSLALDLEAKLSRRSPPSSRSVAANDNLGRPSGKRTSALAQCCKLATTSELYRYLRDDLLAGSVAELCLRRGWAAGGLFVLEQIALHQQVAAADSAQGHEASRERLNQTKFRYRSPLVAANLSLLAVLNCARKHTAPLVGPTSSSGNRSSARQPLDPCNADLLINMASYHMYQGNFEQARELLATISAPRWPIVFNRWLSSAAIIRSHPEELGIDLVTSDDENSLRRGSLEGPASCDSFSQTKMALLGLKLAAVYESVGLIQKSTAVLADLLPPSLQHSAKISPELSLLTATTTTTSIRVASSAHESAAAETPPPITILSEASRWHPYHIPLAERLIALHISEFDYKSATRALVNCVKNRPDQVRWYQMLAECHQRDANYNEAIRIYRHAIESFPGSESCAKALAKLRDELGLVQDKC